MKNLNLKTIGGILILLSVLLPEFCLSQVTTVMVRAQSKDAKFIGSSIGGAKVIIRNAITGEIMAEGITEGSTGDTGRIMSEPKERGKELTDESTAGYLAELDIDSPVFVTVEVIAPINKKQARVSSSTQLWVIPGKNITGDGVVLEVPGFVVDILSPQTHERIASPAEVEISANIIMMCGCPITEGGIWNAAQYEIEAIIKEKEEGTRKVDLEVQEKPSTFSGKTTLQSGYYEITVIAFDPATGNTGLDKTNILIE